MNRRTFLKALAAVPAVGFVAPGDALAALPKATIKRVRIYRPPTLNPLFNQSNMVVTVESDIGITGIGEGGAKDTLEQCAGTLIGKNPFRTDALWQESYIAWFYPPGREKAHALGALDLALWDIKGKALGVPVHELLGGSARDYCECYATGGVTPAGTQAGARPGLKERAKATMEAGYRAFRMGAAEPPIGGVYDTRSIVRQVAQDCKDVREAVGPDGNWCIDFHQRFDMTDALRVCRAIEEYEPFFVEDPVRDENALQDIPKLRQMTTVPLTHGEEWGLKWDFNRLVENHDIDFIRSTLPNVGGITEMLKIMAVCDTHRVGIVPHFTGPVATAGHMQTMMAFPGQVLMEYNQGERPVPYLPEFLECRNGKVWPNDRPGLGLTVDERQLVAVETVTQGAAGATQRRLDGSLTHW